MKKKQGGPKINRGGVAAAVKGVCQGVKRWGGQKQVEERKAGLSKQRKIGGEPASAQYVFILSPPLKATVV